MRKLLILILLAGAFYGGYCTGRLPGAPDLSPFAKKCGAAIVKVSRRAVQWAAVEWEKLQAPAPAQAAETGAVEGQEE